MNTGLTYGTRFLALVPALAFLAACAGEPVRQGGDDHVQVATAERQIVLTVPQARTEALRFTGAPGRPYVRRSSYGSSTETERVLNQLAADYDLQRVDGWHIASLGVYCEVLELTGDHSIAETLARLNADARVDSAQQMNLFNVLASARSSGYTDPYAGMQPALEMLQLEDAHRWSRGQGVTVAVIDTGVDRRHPELERNIVAAEDFVGARQPSAARDVHGTAVTGVIASRADNGIGIVGVAPDASILALRACWTIRDGEAGARCSSFTLAKALEFSIANEADVLNLSLAGPSDPLLLRLVEVALSRGILVVAAVDTERQGAGFPADVSRVISVDVASSDWHARATGRGQLFRVAAPGTNVLTTTPDGNFGFLSGSSIAAAHVSGVSALLLERAPDLSPDEVASLLFGLMRSRSPPAAARAWASRLRPQSRAA